MSRAEGTTRQRAPLGPATTPGPGPLRLTLLGASFALLVAVGVLGSSAAKPPLGPRGWAPGDLPWHPSSGLVTGLLAAAYLLGAAGVALMLRRPPKRIWPLRPSAGWTAGTPSWVASWAPPLALGVLALLTGPFGSADHTNYAAYGRIAAQGGDPYLVPPVAWAGGHDPVTSRVEPPWTETVSIYGPLATLLQALTSLIGGTNLRETVWAWQVVTVLAWLAVRWVLLRAGADPVRVDTLWTANPLVFGVGVLGAHLDVVAAALALAAVVVAARSPVAAGLLTGLAVSTKVTYGVVGLAVLLAWLRHERGDRGRLLRRVVVYAVSALVVVVPLHLWAGPHVFDQLLQARRSVSLATPWRLLVEVLTGPLPSATVRSLVSTLAVLLFLAFVWLLARLTRGRAPETVTGTALRWTFVLATAYALAAPYSLPWYDQLTWATLPVLAASALDLVLLARLAVLALAYVPGRVVGMSRAVESATLGFRRVVAPWTTLVLWAALTLVWRRASRRTADPRPGASAR